MDRIDKFWKHNFTQTTEDFKSQFQDHRYMGYNNVAWVPSLNAKFAEFTTGEIINHDNILTLTIVK